MAHDVRVQNEGSIVLFALESEAAREWWAEHVPDEGFQMSPVFKVVEHRYAPGLAEGMQADGLQVV